MGCRELGELWLVGCREPGETWPVGCLVGNMAESRGLTAWELAGGLAGAGCCWGSRVKTRPLLTVEGGAQGEGLDAELTWL